MPDDPVQPIPIDKTNAVPKPGVGLCLSGDGYRAMVFHSGVLWRLYETGLLRKANRISSVSGGSMTAVLLALKWNNLSFDPARLQSDFVRHVIDPIRSLARETIDAEAIILGIALPGRISGRVASAYEEHLFGKATLQDLPDEPRFVINAANVQSGALWRFMKPYMRDYRVGRPSRLHQHSLPCSRLQRRPFTSKVVLSDGGVYDNLGLETVWKRYETVLVSDGGGKMQPEEEPKSDWARHSFRVLNLIDNQVRSLRKRQVIDSYRSGARKGAYGGIRTNIEEYGLRDVLDCPFERTTQLAETPTRLKRMDDELQERLINWGYAVCDAAVRKHVDPALPRPGNFPYPSAGV